VNHDQNKKKVFKSVAAYAPPKTFNRSQNFKSDLSVYTQNNQISHEHLKEKSVCECVHQNLISVSQKNQWKNWAHNSINFPSTYNIIDG
jgi:hypothetical protein